MAFHLDLKAIGYGFAVFIGGYGVMSFVASLTASVAESSPSKLGWILITVAGYLVPVIAGYVAAYFASARRILNGTIGGTLGVLLMLVPAVFVPDYPFSGIPIVIASHGVLASLGAIFGNHRRGKVGA